jgi:hypothetical protein
MRFLALISLIALFGYCRPGQAEVLIAAQEAKLPREANVVPTISPANPDQRFNTDRGTPLRPPDVSFESPKDLISSPFRLHVIFTPHNGSRIDPDSVTVTLLTKPEVDLTNRLRPYITANGVNFAQAEAPPGDSPLRITLADSNGNLGTYVIDLRVQRP